MRLTSIYLASKAENYPMSLASFCAQVNKNSAPRPPGQPPSAARGDVTEQIIADLEFGMVQTLDFELAVHGAHRALYGLILDLQTVEPSLTRDDLLALASEIQSYLHLSRFSDAEFLFTPSHIALASCWISSAPRPGREALSGKSLVEKWLASKEKLSTQIHQQRVSLRAEWHAKHKALRPVSQPEDELQAAQAPQEHSPDNNFSAMYIQGILEKVAEEILSVAAPSQGDGKPPRPHVDTEQVKQIDLHLRSNLLAFEKMQMSM